MCVRLVQFLGFVTLHLTFSVGISVHYLVNPGISKWADEAGLAIGVIVGVLTVALTAVLGG
jgi:hypothetical protein